MTHKSYIWAIVAIVIIAAIIVLSSPQTKVPPAEEEVLCSTDVRQCSDGSFVSREAPSCSFAPCPEGTILLDEERPEILQ